MKSSEKNKNSLNNESDKKESNKKENPKLKLLSALNNINDEINVKIDSKDKLFNTNKFNLDCFINKQSLSSSRTKSPEKFVNKITKKNYISPPINKEESFQPFVKTETSNEQTKNLRKINKIKDKSNIRTDPKQLMKYINSENSKFSKSKYSENNKSINKNIENNSIKKIVYINKNDKNEEIKQSSNNNYIEEGKKITLYNLENEDKLLLKDLESKNALLITDISSLNKKNNVNYNISLSNFNPKTLLNYYLKLEKKYKKEQEEKNNLKIEAEGLKNEYLNIKRKEINNNKENNKDNNNIDINTNNYKLSDIQNQNNYSTLNLGKNNPASRYLNDLNYFEDLIIKMNDEIKSI